MANWQADSKAIAVLNDEARKGVLSVLMGKAHGGSSSAKLMFTRGIQEMTANPANIPGLLSIVASFNSFNRDNDPYGERDFFSFDWKGEKCFCKIDYYNNDLTLGSEDPSNRSITTRVITIMLASEY